jgi:hypothetical protein
MPIALPSPKDLFTGELAVNGNWVVANLDSGVPWPTKLVKITFRDRVSIGVQNWTPIGVRP